jgi:chorismate dehydratase
MKLGLVPYLNGRPFAYGLASLAPETEVIQAAPSRLEALLDSAEVECALLPSLTALARPDLSLLPGTAIVCGGPARSVRLFSRVALEAVQTVALDSSSRASAALTQILLAERDLHPAFILTQPDLEAMLSRADAALLIGDLGLSAQPADLIVTDLGELWHEMTSLPFVFAFWAARPRDQGSGTRGQGSGADIGALTELLLRAKDLGCAHLDAIAEAEAPRLGLPVELCLSYLRDSVQFDLDAEALVGLRRFQKLALKHGLLTDARDLPLPLD